jgi:2,7-dihydroxy-5-methyl-1-naphthoate 7-O-methyltransferase
VGNNLWALSDLCTPWCVHVVATLRIAEHIEAGVTGIDELAAAAGCDADPLRRVLKVLAGRDVFVEPTPGTFALTDTGRGLLDPSLRLALDLDSFGGRMAGAWSSLLTAVRTGEPAYREVFGRPFWADLDAHPGIAADFDALMGEAGHGKPDPEVLLGGEWDSVRTVVDVGGGTGSLLAEILRARPGVRGTLVDLPRAVAGSAEIFSTAGVADRVDANAQSFFDPLPAGADLYVLKSVIADWPDAEATAILRRCAEAARAARPPGRVVVMGGATPEAGSDDLLMLVLVGGKERTVEEFRALAGAAGLTVTRTGQQPSGRFLVELQPG